MLIIKQVGFILFLLIIGFAGIFITLYGICSVIVRGIGAILEGDK